MNAIWLVPLVVLVTMILTGMLRSYALSRSMIDIPNERSSHSTPTPRGGGVSVVLTFLAAVCLLFVSNLLSSAMFLAVCGSGGLVALIGFIDDHGHLAPRWRLLGHFSAGAWALFWMGGLPPLDVLGYRLELQWLGYGLAALYLVWLLNLYNFMDGIDGIASVEGITACLSAAAIYILSGHINLAWPPVMLAMALCGFLYWNFPPARIFMGDAGSGFIGIILGVFSLQAGWAASEFFFIWIILLGVFIIDATLTLIRRLLRGERVHEAHRSHAYQYASRQCGRHLPVTLGVLAINVFWLFPVACAVAMDYVDGLIGVVISYLPLVFLAVKYHAGQREVRT
jgi:Fuc2NAc and GlcNAc transferase